MSRRILNAVLPLAVAVSLCYILLALRVALPVISDDSDAMRVFGGLALNELGDFLGGVCGPLALLWIVVSVTLQGAELREQRREMARQADAVLDQSKYIRTQLEHAEQVKAWADTRDILSELREQVPLVGDGIGDASTCPTVRIAGGKDVVFAYRCPPGANPERMSLSVFLGRAAGGIGYPAKALSEALDRGASVTCVSPGLMAIRVERMQQLVSAAADRGRLLPDHQQLILAGCRLEDWTAHLAVFARALRQGRRAE